MGAAPSKDTVSICSYFRGSYEIALVPLTNYFFGRDDVDSNVCTCGKAQNGAASDKLDDGDGKVESGRAHAETCPARCAACVNAAQSHPMQQQNKQSRTSCAKSFQDYPNVATGTPRDINRKQLRAHLIQMRHDPVIRYACSRDRENIMRTIRQYMKKAKANKANSNGHNSEGRVALTAQAAMPDADKMYSATTHTEPPPASRKMGGSSSSSSSGTAYNTESRQQKQQVDVLAGGDVDTARVGRRSEDAYSRFDFIDPTDDSSEDDLCTPEELEECYRRHYWDVMPQGNFTEADMDAFLGVVEKTLYESDEAMVDDSYYAAGSVLNVCAGVEAQQRREHCNVGNGQASASACKPDHVPASYGAGADNMDGSKSKHVRHAKTSIDASTRQSSSRRQFIPIPCALCLAYPDGKERPGCFVLDGRYVNIIGYFGLFTEEMLRAFKTEKFDKSSRQRDTHAATPCDAAHAHADSAGSSSSPCVLAPTSSFTLSGDVTLHLHTAILTSAGDRTLERVLVLASVMFRQQFHTACRRVYANRFMRCGPSAAPSATSPVCTRLGSAFAISSLTPQNHSSSHTNNNRDSFPVHSAIAADTVHAVDAHMYGVVGDVGGGDVCAQSPRATLCAYEDKERMTAACTTLTPHTPTTRTADSSVYPVVSSQPSCSIHMSQPPSQPPQQPLSPPYACSLHELSGLSSLCERVAPSSSSVSPASPTLDKQFLSALLHRTLPLIPPEMYQCSRLPGKAPGTTFSGMWASTAHGKSAMALTGPAAAASREFARLSDLSVHSVSSGGDPIPVMLQEMEEAIVWAFLRRLQCMAVVIEIGSVNYSALKSLTENFAFLHSQVAIDPQLANMELVDLPYTRSVKETIPATGITFMAATAVGTKDEGKASGVEKGSGLTTATAANTTAMPRGGSSAATCRPVSPCAAPARVVVAGRAVMPPAPATTGPCVHTTAASAAATRRSTSSRDGGSSVVAASSNGGCSTYATVHTMSAMSPVATAAASHPASDQAQLAAMRNRPCRSGGYLMDDQMYNLFIKLSMNDDDSGDDDESGARQPEHANTHSQMDNHNPTNGMVLESTARQTTPLPGVASSSGRTSSLWAGDGRESMQGSDSRNAVLHAQQDTEAVACDDWVVPSKAGAGVKDMMVCVSDGVEQRRVGSCPVAKQMDATTPREAEVKTRYSDFRAYMAHVFEDELGSGEARDEDSHTQRLSPHSSIIIALQPDYVRQAAMWTSCLFHYPSIMPSGQWLQYKLKDECDELRHVLQNKDTLIAHWRRCDKVRAVSYLGTHTEALLAHVRRLQDETERARLLPMDHWTSKRIYVNQDGRKYALHRSSYGTMLIGVRVHNNSNSGSYPMHDNVYVRRSVSCGVGAKHPISAAACPHSHSASSYMSDDKTGVSSSYATFCSSPKNISHRESSSKVVCMREASHTSNSIRGVGNSSSKENSILIHCSLSSPVQNGHEQGGHSGRVSRDSNDRRDGRGSGDCGGADGNSGSNSGRRMYKNFITQVNTHDCGVHNHLNPTTTSLDMHTSAMANHYSGSLTDGRYRLSKLGCGGIHTHFDPATTTAFSPSLTGGSPLATIALTGLHNSSQPRQCHTNDVWLTTPTAVHSATVTIPATATAATTVKTANPSAGMSSHVVAVAVESSPSDRCNTQSSPLAHYMAPGIPINTAYMPAHSRYHRNPNSVMATPTTIATSAASAVNIHIAAPTSTTMNMNVATAMASSSPSRPQPQPLPSAATAVNFSYMCVPSMTMMDMVPSQVTNSVTASVVPQPLYVAGQLFTDSNNDSHMAHAVTAAATAFSPSAAPFAPSRTTKQQRCEVHRHPSRERVNKTTPVTMVDSESQHSYPAPPPPATAATSRMLGVAESATTTVSLPRMGVRVGNSSMPIMAGPMNAHKSSNLAYPINSSSSSSSNHSRIPPAHMIQHEVDSSWQHEARTSTTSSQARPHSSSYRSPVSTEDTTARRKSAGVVQVASPTIPPHYSLAHAPCRVASPVSEHINAYYTPHTLNQQQQQLVMYAPTPTMMTNTSYEPRRHATAPSRVRMRAHPHAPMRMSHSPGSGSTAPSSLHDADNANVSTIATAAAKAETIYGSVQATSPLSINHVDTIPCFGRSALVNAAQLARLDPGRMPSHNPTGSQLGLTAFASRSSPVTHVMHTDAPVVARSSLVLTPTHVAAHGQSQPPPVHPDELVYSDRNAQMRPSRAVMHKPRGGTPSPCTFPSKVTPDRPAAMSEGQTSMTYAIYPQQTVSVLHRHYYCNDSNN